MKYNYKLETGAAWKYDKPKIETDDYEYRKLKHYAFIYAYRRQHSWTPGNPKKGIPSKPWPKWWSEKFGEDFNEYLKKLQEKKDVHT